MSEPVTEKETMSSQPTFTVRTKAGLAFSRAWQRWRGDDLLPDRARMNIEDIKDLLPSIVIVDVLDRDTMPVRLAGTAIRETLGVELTGINYLDLADTGQRERRARLLYDQALQPCGSYTHFPVPLKSGLTLKVECVCYPVLPEPGSDRLPQLVAVNALLDDPGLLDPVGRVVPVGTAEVFGYIDIGAGVPVMDQADFGHLCVQVPLPT